jgi:hypothetical protein
MKKFVIVSLGILIFSLNAISQKEALSTIDKEDLKAYMTFFASDEMEGRETGSLTNDAAALFIKSNLMRLGLKPIPGSGDYFQKIPLITTKTDKMNSFLRIYDTNGNVINTTDSVVSLMTPGKTMEVKGNVVFAGYGYENKNTGYSDYEGIDIKGKIVMIMTRNPEAVNDGTGKTIFDNQLESMKFSPIIMRGPLAILYVYDPGNNFRDAYDSGMADLIQPNSVALKGKQGLTFPLQVLFITRNTADNLLKPSGYSLEQMQGRISLQGKPVSAEIQGITAIVKTSVEVSEFSGSNVIGIIEGSDPVLKDECIIYTAHFDHTGKNRNGEIFNGADDNASGSIALLEVADAFMNLKKKPLRTIVFAWVNGEEKGLLGSRFYTDNPVFPIEKTLVDLNLDMVGRSVLPSDTGKIAGFKVSVTQPGEIEVYTSHESSELLNMMTAAARETGIKVTDKGKDLEFGGSDHESFMAKGVPALFFNSGIHSDLHSIRDDIGKIDFDKMEKVSKMVFLLGYKVANQRKRLIVDNQQ